MKLPPKILLTAMALGLAACASSGQYASFHSDDQRSSVKFARWNSESAEVDVTAPTEQTASSGWSSAPVANVGSYASAQPMGTMPEQGPVTGGGVGQMPDINDELSNRRGKPMMPAEGATLLGKQVWYGLGMDKAAAAVDRGLH